MAMKAKHYLITALIVVGALYALHMWNSHGTGKQFLAGLGYSR